MKYLAVFRISARQVWNARGDALARVVFYIILLLIFSRLWKVVAQEGGIGGIGAVAFLWYIALTEWVTLAVPMFYLGIEEEVRRGDIAYAVGRPISYLGLKIAEGAGQIVVRLLFLAVAGIVGAWLCAGAFPADPRGLLLVIPLGLLSALLILLIQVGIGLSVIWLQDGAPVHWVTQKLMFVFGGLMFPLEIYPDWLREAALWTPFAAMIHGCGRMAFGFEPWLALEIFGKLVLWGGLLFLFVFWVFRKSLRVLSVNGG